MHQNRKSMNGLAAGALAACLWCTGLPAQELALASHPHPAPQHPADVGSIEGIVHAFYQAISAEAGGKLDRVQLEALFVPTGRIAVGIEASQKRPADVVFLSPAEYADQSDKSTSEKGFFDHNVANQVESFGVMAHVYSVYESRNSPADASPMARGVKSFELLHSAGRWYIVQVYWDSERAGNPIPAAWLSNHSSGGGDGAAGADGVPAGSHSGTRPRP